MKNGQYWVYLLQCSDNSIYVGMTNDLELRLQQHENGAVPSCYTFRRRPLTLLHAAPFPTAAQAIAREKQLKGWSRAKKLALAKEDWAQLQLLSLRKDDQKLRNEGEEDAPSGSGSSTSP